MAAVVGCETKAQNGAIIGGLTGAVIGGAIGNNNGSTAAGAAIGGLVGAGGGAIVGNEMDKADKKKEREDYYERNKRDDYNYERRNDSYSYESRGNGSSSTQLGTREIIEWSDRGVKDEIIIDRIQRSGQTFKLTAAQESDLRDAGVSSSVIRAMKDTARR